VGLPVRVGIGATRILAQLAARAGAGLLVVPPGAEQEFLAPRPLGLLDPEPDVGLALERWGIETLGALAALPTAALLARLGPAAVRLQALARGTDPGPFVPQLMPEPCREAITLDWEVPSLPALAFILDRLLAQLAARLALREAGATALRVTLRLADGCVHEHHLGVAAPLRDGRTLGRLLRAELEALRLPAPVVAVAVEAEPGLLAPLQTDLFAPPRPSPRELGEILGRLAALVGADRVGAPVAPDTHRPDAGLVAPFPGDVAPPARGSRPPLWVTGAALVRRRLVPPRPARVECRAGRPIRVEAEGFRGAVVAAAGPWPTAGEWWAETAWAREEWDVALPDGAVCRLTRDLPEDAWTVDAVYD
jgi:protein ImuB